MPGRIEVVDETKGNNPGKRYDLVVWGKEGEGTTTIRLNKGGGLVDLTDPILILVSNNLSLTPDKLIEKLEGLGVGQELNWG